MVRGERLDEKDSRSVENSSFVKPEGPGNNCHSSLPYNQIQTCPVKHLEALSLQKISEVRFSFGQQGFMKSLGAQLSALSPGKCIISIPFSDAVSQQNGFFHGGVIGAVGDVAGGYASLTLMPEGAEILTVEYKINFLRPAIGWLLIAEGSVVRTGRAISVTRVDVFSEKDDKRSLCAVLQLSMINPQSIRA